MKGVLYKGTHALWLKNPHPRKSTPTLPRGNHWETLFRPSWKLAKGERLAPYPTGTNRASQRPGKVFHLWNNSVHNFVRSLLNIFSLVLHLLNPYINKQNLPTGYHTYVISCTIFIVGLYIKRETCTRFEHGLKYAVFIRELLLNFRWKSSKYQKFNAKNLTIDKSFWKNESIQS